MKRISAKTNNFSYLYYRLIQRTAASVSLQVSPIPAQPQYSGPVYPLTHSICLNKNANPKRLAFLLFKWWLRLLAKLYQTLLQLGVGLCGLVDG